MQRCKYGLVPRGAGAHSYRLMEVMSAGGVPVIIGAAGGLLPPFSGMLRWEFFSVAVPGRDVPHLRTILRAIPHNKWASLQRNVTTVFDLVFSADRKILDTAFSALRHDAERCERPTL